MNPIRRAFVVLGDFTLIFAGMFDPRVLICLVPKQFRFEPTPPYTQDSDYRLKWADMLNATEEQVEVLEPAQRSLESLLEAYWQAKTPEAETQALEDLRRYYPDGDWKLQPKAPKWVRDLVDAETVRACEGWHAAGFGSDFPLCNCAGRQAADLDDHRPACAARAAGKSPAGVSSPPTLPPAGRQLDPDEIVAQFQNLLGNSDSRPVPTLGEVYLTELKPCNQNYRLPCTELPGVYPILKHLETDGRGAVYDLEIRVRNTYCPHVQQ